MIEFDIGEDIYFDGTPVVDIIRRLTELDKAYNNLKFRLDYNSNEYGADNRRLYLAAKREETDEELKARLVQEAEDLERAKNVAARQINQLRARFPDLF